MATTQSQPHPISQPAFPSLPWVQLQKIIDPNQNVLQIKISRSKSRLFSFHLNILFNFRARKQDVCDHLLRSWLLLLLVLLFTDQTGFESFEPAFGEVELLIFRRVQLLKVLLGQLSQSFTLTVRILLHISGQFLLNLGKGSSTASFPSLDLLQPIPSPQVLNMNAILFAHSLHNRVEGALALSLFPLDHVHNHLLKLNRIRPIPPSSVPAPIPGVLDLGLTSDTLFDILVLNFLQVMFEDIGLAQTVEELVGDLGDPLADGFVVWAWLHFFGLQILQGLIQYQQLAAVIVIQCNLVRALLVHDQYQCNLYRSRAFSALTFPYSTSKTSTTFKAC